MLKREFAFVLSLLLLTGCMSFSGTYTFNMTDVERPENSTEKYGDFTTEVNEDGGIVYEDSLIKCAWLVGASRFSFTLENKTNNSIKIIWDECAYINENGATGRIMHSGVKYTDKNASQPPSVVVRGARIDEIMLPTDNVYYISGQYGGWRTKPLFTNRATTQADLDVTTKNTVGKNVRILMPLQIKGVTNEYVFNFEITGFNQTSSPY